MALLTVNRLLRSMKHLSLSTTIWIFFTFFLVIFGSFLTPIFLRFLLLPKATIHEEHLDFTFRTCEDQLSGVCSYPEAVLDLNQLGNPLSPGYYYSLTLKLELFDTDQNQKLGIFQAQITAKDENQKVLSSFKKPLIFRRSFLSTIYVFVRNTIFFPLYLIGFFNTNDAIQTVIFTNNFYESSLKPTNYLVVQIQNRFVQVASAFLEIRAIVGFSTWLFNDFPIISFFFISTMSFMANFAVFMIYWSVKGVHVYVEEEEELILEEKTKSEAKNKKNILQRLIDVISGFIPLKMIKSKELRPKTPEPEPSPNVWNVDEVPASQTLENFPDFVNLPDENDVDDAIISLREQLENHTTNFDGSRRRHDMLQRIEKPGLSSINCPGFCGKILLNVTNHDEIYSDCTACPWGTKVLNNFKCNECTNLLQNYDLTFLIFHGLIPFLINSCFIRSYSFGPKKQRKMPRIWIGLQFLSAALESFLAFMFTMLIFKPYGSLKIYTCQKHFLFEWYPMFYNPVVNFTRTLKCSSELVYPMFSFPFANLAFNLLNLLILRTLLYSLAAFKSEKKLSPEPYYAVLWTLPLVSLVHSICSGLIYYSFPYIMLLTSLTLTAFHFAYEGRKNIKQLLQIILTEPENLITMIIHMILFGFSLYSIYLSVPNYFSLSKTKIYGLIGALLPLPSVFYIITVKLTIPQRSTIRYPRI